VMLISVFRVLIEIVLIACDADLDDRCLGDTG